MRQGRTKTQPQIKDKPDVVPEERREKLMQVFGRELTTDEIIRFVRDFAAQTRRHKDCHDCLYIDMALTLADEVEALRRAAPENKPLTLEQLRQMDGEPVWVVMIGEAKPPICEIVVECYKNGIKMASTEDTDDYGAFDLYGKTWLAYARRQEDAQKEGDKS